MSYYPEPESHIRDKVKVVLHCQIMLLKKLEHETGIGTSDLAAKKSYIILKVEVDKLDVNKRTNVQSSLNKLKT